MTNSAQIDLGAIGHNLDMVRRSVGPAALMGVVKAGGYGHGMVQIARAAREQGIEWLGVATLAEARTLRASGDAGRVLAWLWAPGDPDLDDCLLAGVDISAASVGALDEIIVRSAAAGVTPRVHLKVDTGLSRNGTALDDWPALVQAAELAQRRGRAQVVGIWSHLANADRPADASVQAQQRAFDDALAAASGLAIEVRHLANSAGALSHPSTRYDLVRIGIAMYGVSPDAAPAASHGLRAAMTLRGTLALVKRIPAGASASYGGIWTAPQPSRVGLLPIGYADGLPRIAGNRAEVLVRGVRCPVVGRIAMDQCIVVLDDVEGDVAAGEEVTVFGDAAVGAPTADDWGAASDSIGYEIVTRIGPRIPRIYEGAS